jgi:hypothetical protein
VLRAYSALALFFDKKPKVVDTKNTSAESYSWNVKANGGNMIRAIVFDEWINRVNQLLEFCLDRKAESFDGIFWDALYEQGFRPLEVATALIEEYQAVTFQSCNE